MKFHRESIKFFGNQQSFHRLPYSSDICSVDFHLWCDFFKFKYPTIKWLGIFDFFRFGNHVQQTSVQTANFWWIDKAAHAFELKKISNEIAPITEKCTTDNNILNRMTKVFDCPYQVHLCGIFRMSTIKPQNLIQKTCFAQKIIIACLRQQRSFT